MVWLGKAVYKITSWEWTVPCPNATITYNQETYVVLYRITQNIFKNYNHSKDINFSFNQEMDFENDCVIANMICIKQTYVIVNSKHLFMFILNMKQVRLPVRLHSVG